MTEEKVIEAYCDVCGEPQHHTIDAADPSTCKCTVCGHEQQLMVPAS